MPAPCRANTARVVSWLAASLLALLTVALPATAQQRIDLPSRPGVTQPIYLTAASNPVASAILFPGGSGLASQLHSNFLIRVAPQFAASGITVAVADAPSDHNWALETAFRAGEAQAADTAAIVAFLRSRAAVPVWVVGTSRGSISAANAAVRLGPSQLAGVVLTSSVWVGGMSAVPISAIRIPALIVHNRDDGCSQSPFNQAAPALATITAAPAKELIAVSGGSPWGKPCEAKSTHGYYGIEGQVVPLIVAWIKAH